MAQGLLVALLGARLAFQASPYVVLASPWAPCRGHPASSCLPQPQCPQEMQEDNQYACNIAASKRTSWQIVPLHTADLRGNNTCSTFTEREDSHISFLTHWRLPRTRANPNMRCRRIPGAGNIWGLGPPGPPGCMPGGAGAYIIPPAYGLPGMPPGRTRKPCGGGPYGRPMYVIICGCCGEPTHVQWCMSARLHLPPQTVSFGTFQS